MMEDCINLIIQNSDVSIQTLCTLRCVNKCFQAIANADIEYKQLLYKKNKKKNKGKLLTSYSLNVVSSYDAMNLYFLSEREVSTLDYIKQFSDELHVMIKMFPENKVKELALLKYNTVRPQEKDTFTKTKIKRINQFEKVLQKYDLQNMELIYNMKCFTEFKSVKHLESICQKYQTFLNVFKENLMYIDPFNINTLFTEYCNQDVNATNLKLNFIKEREARRNLLIAQLREHSLPYDMNSRICTNYVDNGGNINDVITAYKHRLVISSRFPVL